MVLAYKGEWEDSLELGQLTTPWLQPTLAKIPEVGGREREATLILPNLVIKSALFVPVRN